MKRKINFIGIGAQKAGTSWLAEALNEHPDAYIHPKKECHFFNKNQFYINKFLYEKSFKHQNQKIIGEITPAYILSEKTAKRIFNYNPEIQLILITRDPTERAISQYKMEIGRKRFNKDISFKEIFDNNIEQIRERGEYSKKLKKYYNYFNKEQILILKYEDLRNDANNFIKKVYDFLNINTEFKPTCLLTKIRHPKDKPEDIKIQKEDIEYIKNYYTNKN